jgi:hypothetical protein
MNTNPKFAWSIATVLGIFLIISVTINFFLYTQKAPASSPAPTITPSFQITPQSSPTPTPVRLISPNKSYTFAITDGAGNKLGEFTFLIIKIERTKEIDIAGQKAKAVPGKDLVIVDAELTNKGNITAKTNSRNYLRLRVNKEDKLLAPDFHPDPVDLTPQSTKSVRFGFAIAENDRELILQVGELDGLKDSIILNF